MPIEDLAIAEKEPFKLSFDSPDGVAQLVHDLTSKRMRVRVVRGRKSRTVGSLFDEVAAALQFPAYFGENWPAFDECLADMEWFDFDRHFRPYRQRRRSGLLAAR